MGMTHKQKQQLLGYLGLYTGATDGIWGPKSREAARQFQQKWLLEKDETFGNASQDKIRLVIGSGEEGNWWDKVRWFRREEFRCRCGGKYCGGFPAEPEQGLVELADRVRTQLDRPMVVTSGVRCKRHNAACGGVVNSRHLTGKAMDFGVEGYSADAVLATVRKLPGVRYAYAIDGCHVHMDIE